MAKKKSLPKKLMWAFMGLIVLPILILIINLIVFEKTAGVVSEGEPIANYENGKSALLVIDIQEGTTGECPMNPVYHENSDSYIAAVNDLIQYFKERESAIVYVRSEITNPLINVLNNSFAKGSVGAQLDKRLNIASDMIVVKSRNDAFINTQLDSLLVDNQINELYVVGLDAAYCVNKTVEAAQNRKYKVTLINEGILSESTAMKDSMLTNYIDRGVQIVKMKELPMVEDSELIEIETK